jgi:uncharacterized protein YdgA (DUF945 family)
MKKIVVVVVLLAAVLLLAPFGIGRLAEKRLNQGVDKILEQAPYFKVAERSWSGGWFKSEQVITFELSDAWADVMSDEALEKLFKSASAAAGDAAAEGDEQAPAVEAGLPADDAAEAPVDAEPEEAVSADLPQVAREPVRFTIRNEVLHGPILGAGLGLARVDSHLELSDKIRKEIAEVFGEEPALRVRTRVGFFGGGTTTFSSEGRKLNVKEEGADVSYETFKLAVGYSRNLDSYDMDGGLPKFVARDADGGQFSITGVSIEGKGERVMGDLYDGEAAFRIQSIEVQDKNKSETMSIADAHYLVDSRTKDDFVTMTAKVGTGAVKGPEFAEQMGIQEVHYDLSFRHLHAPTLEKMVAAMRNIYASPLVDPSQVEQAIYGPIKEHSVELLKHDPEFGIDRLGLVTADGEIVAKGAIKLVGVTPEDFTAGPFGVIGKVDADITLTADIKVVEKLPDGASTVAMAVDSGYAKKEGEQLICRVVFRNGELTVNGKPQAIPGLGGPPPGAMEQGGMEGDPNAMPMPVPPQE